MALLRIKPYGTHPATEHVLSTTAATTIGRHPNCDVVLDAASVSREHAQITYSGDQFRIEDLNSRNGTNLNGNLIPGKLPLCEGDVIRICDVEMRYHTVYSEDTERTFGNTGSSSFGSSVMITDEKRENPLERVKNRITLDSHKPQLNIANAEVKLRALIDIVRNIGGTSKEVLSQMLTNLLTIFRQADCACVMIRDQFSQKLELAEFVQRDPNREENYRISRTVHEAVAQSKSAILSDDVANDSRFDVSDSIVNFHIFSLMAVPIMNTDQNEVVGVIQVDSRATNKKFTYDDLDLLVSVAYQMGIAYENAALHDVRIKDDMLEREMKVAKRVQMGFLPDKPPVVPGYDFYGFYQAARQLGGDFYDYLLLPDGRVAIVLGDVSGKGTSAALVMAKLASEVRYGLLMEPTAAKVMRRLNNVYCDPRWEDRFVTFIFAVLTPATGVIQFYNAGHIPPILCASDRPAHNICPDIGGLPFGIVADSEYEEFTITLSPGEKIVLLSDGLTDAMNQQGQCFTLGAILDTLSKSGGKTAFDCGENLLAVIRSFVGKTPQTDDQCIAICGRNE